MLSGRWQRFKAIGPEGDIQKRVLDAICGHAPRHVGAAYGDVTLKTMAAAVAKLPCFEAIRPVAKL